MRIIAIIPILILLGDLLAASASDQIPHVEQDTIFLRQGDRLIGKLTGIDEQSIQLRRLLPAHSTAPPDAAPVYASVSILRSHVDRVEFSPDERQRLLLKNASLRNVSEIEDLWHEARLWLPIPKSPAAEIGLAYGDLLLQSGGVADIRKALSLFMAIEKEAWSRSDAARARQGRLRAMVAQGSLQEAIAEAKEIERTSKNPAILIEAKFILAKAAEKALRKLLDDNPRWEEDASVRPQRDRLYQEALEHYFYPALFYGSEVEVASRGLWGRSGDQPIRRRSPAGGGRRPAISSKSIRRHLMRGKRRISSTRSPNRRQSNIMKVKQNIRGLFFFLFAAGMLLLPATAAASAVETHKSLLDLYREGGPVMHIIALCSVATLALGAYCGIMYRKGRMIHRLFAPV